MSAKRKHPARKPAEPEVQAGHGKSKRKDERLKRVVKQHPQRDEQLVDSVEKYDLPPS